MFFTKKILYISKKNSLFAIDKKYNKLYTLWKKRRIN